MRIVVLGGTGFIGRHLVETLARLGAECVAVSRSGRGPWHRSRIRVVAGDATEPGAWGREVDGADVVVNLAGVPLVERLHRWTAARKALLRHSRIESTRNVVRAIREADAPPRALINASAVGYYGEGGDRTLDEASPPGEGFLTTLCRDWEAAALEGQDVARVVVLRTGLVLGVGGGFLAPLLPLFRLGAGGAWGSGRQWWPWVHMADQIGIMRLALERDDVSGPLNLTAPNPVRVREFARELGAALHRPALVPAPAVALRLALGEAAESLLVSQRVRPTKALDTGYRFRFPELPAAFGDLFGRD